MGDIYDRQFIADLNLAKILISNLSDRDDRQICCKWIRKLCSLGSEHKIVKKHRNYFLRYLLKVMQSSSIEEQQAYGFLTYDNVKKGPLLEKTKGFTAHWSPDRRIYIAAKPLPGEGSLVYMAVSNDPGLGWDIPYTKQ